MSLATWQEKYYPVPASEATGSELEAAEHSLRKWRGLRDLAAHGLIKVEGLISGRDGFLCIDDGSCALCNFHTNEGMDEPGCGECILSAVNAGVACDQPHGTGKYQEWVFHSDPEPMIVLLEQAVERLKAEVPDAA